MGKKNVLGISFGRKLMNTEILVKTALMECEKAGCQVHFLRADDLDIKPCTGCCACAGGYVFGNGKGECRLKDDFPVLEEALYEADAVIYGSPAYVLAPTGKFKIVVDRMGPSHDYSFRKVRREEGIAAGEPEEKLPDIRSMKKRVGAMISVGGAVTENWLSFMLPSMYQLAFPFNIDIVDMFQYHGAMQNKNVLMRGDQIKRAQLAGQNVAAALLAESEEERVKWRGEKEGICPVCHCDLLSIKAHTVECPVCGIEGKLHLEDEGFRAEFTEEAIAGSRLRWGGKIAHSTEIKTCTYQLVQQPDLSEQLKKYKGYAE